MAEVICATPRGFPVWTKDRAPTLATPSPRSSRGEGKGEGQREPSRICLPITFGSKKSKVVRIDVAL
ncbi:MAG: hypothetical protein EOS40_03360 [Mesorhizobium sp.]|nr:MAG: hypothetical protein EOQ40_06190 [Mesorhizobium sp.]RWE03536.1 MAG: hypothetical protein EOS40_03360 [Mesorhizobium sp.]